MPQAQKFLYANGNDHPPTAFDLDKSLLRELLFNLSPTKVRSSIHCYYFFSSLFRIRLSRALFYCSFRGRGMLVLLVNYFLFVVYINLNFTSFMFYTCKLTGHIHNKLIPHQYQLIRD